MTEIEKKMSDITIYHTDDGKEWAEYLQNTLSADKYNIDCSTRFIHDETSHECKLKLILVSPSFLEKENHNMFTETPFSQTEICILILLGVDKSEAAKAIEAAGATNDNWTVLVAAADPEVFREMLVTIIDQFESLQMSENVFRDSFDLSSDDMGHRVSGSSDNSSSNRESTESAGEHIYQTPPRARQIIRIRKVLKEMQSNSEDVYLIMDEESDEPLEIVRDDGLLLDAEVLRKVIYKVKIPDSNDGADSDNIKVGTETSGFHDVSIKKPSAMKILQDILVSQVNPFSYMCSAFGVSENNLQDLDAKLADTFKKFWPSQMAHCFYFLDDTFVLDESKQDSRWPTALHFAAEFKLEKVASTLMEIPGMVSACCLKNVDGEYPHDIATRTNCTAIRKMIESVLENHKRRLEGHDSGFADKTILENPRGGTYMEMGNLRPDSGLLYTHLQNAGRRSEGDTYLTTTLSESHSEPIFSTSPPPPDITTIPSVRDQTREGKTRDRVLSEGDSTGKKNKRSQSLKSSIVAALGNLRKKRPSLEKGLTLSTKIYTRRSSSESMSQEGKKNRGSGNSITSPGIGGVPRDSGSYSEEESKEGATQREHSTSNKKKHKKRKSVRIQRAMKEVPYDLPCVPVYSNDPTFSVDM